MKKGFSTFLAVLSLAGGLQTFGAEEPKAITLESLEQIAEYAASSSLEYRKALLNLEQAKQSQGSALKLDSATLGLTSAYTSTPMPGSDPISYSGSLNVPVLEQLSLSLKVKDDLSGDASINVNPLSHSANDEQARISFQKASVAAESAKASAEKKSVKAVLDWILAEKKMTNQAEAEKLAEQKYKDEKIRYAKGAVTLDALNTALKNWISARNSLITLRQRASQAKLDFYASISANPEDVLIGNIDSEMLEKEIAELKTRLEPQKSDPSVLATVKTSKLDLESAKTKKNSLWIFEPELSVNAGITFSPGDDLSYKAGLSLTFSMDNWKAEEIKLAQKALEQAEEETALAEKNALLNYDLAVLALTAATNNSETARIALASASEINAEAEYLAGKGKASATEVLDAQISLKNAQSELFSALCSEFLALLDVGTYLVN